MVQQVQQSQANKKKAFARLSGRFACAVPYSTQPAVLFFGARGTRHLPRSITPHSKSVPPPAVCLPAQMQKEGGAPKSCRVPARRRRLAAVRATAGIFQR